MTDKDTAVKAEGSAAPAPTPTKETGRYRPAAPRDAGEKEEHIYAPLARAQAKFKSATKDARNPHFKSSYADLASVVDAVQEALNSEGIFYFQPTRITQTGAHVETVFGHKSGQELSAGELFIPSAGKDAQAMGSALTYARRYSLMAACGIAPEDDDANAASGKPGQQGGRNNDKPFVRQPYVPDPANAAPVDLPRGMTPEAVEAHLENIRDAATVDKVNAAYLAARTAAVKNGDKEAITKFTAAGAARKQAIEQDQPGEGA